MRYLTIASLLFALLVSGCGVTTPDYTTPSAPDYDQTSVTVEEGFDSTWDGLIQFTSQRFFAIDSYEKDSGLMTLSFSSDPARFVDCGTISTDGPPAYEGDYIQWFQETPRRSISLDGRMNLTVQETTEEETRIGVNVRYVVTAQAGPQTINFNFNTDGSDTQQVTANSFGATESRTCRPTHEAERVIVEGVQEEI